jgi:protein-L-isoaspartate(D-aspartate) O-methyltransferase
VTFANPMTVSSAVQQALNHVTEENYTLQADGSKLPQTSAPEVIATMLDLLQVRPGQRILEIGTGSGYSTALLSHLVGEQGHITSLDIDPALTRRAEQRLRADGRTNVTLLTDDGAASAPVTAPVDGIVAWATVERVPAAWTRQTLPGALIVTPVSVTDLAKTSLVIRARRGEHARALTADRLLRAGFVEATPHTVEQWIIPPHRVDALAHDDDGRPWWLSATWLRTSDTTSGQDLLLRLISDSRQEAGPLTDQHNAEDFYTYLLALRPKELTTAALGEPLWRIGAATPTGIALITRHEAHHQVAAGDNSAADLLAGWARQWRDLGEPGLEQVQPHLHAVEGEWEVRIVPPALTTASAT